MSYADIRIVGIILILAATYAVFQFEYSAQPPGQINNPGMPVQNYTQPESTGFFDTVNNAVKINMDNPELFFINSILFVNLGLLVVFISLRYLRGTG